MHASAVVTMHRAIVGKPTADRLTTFSGTHLIYCPAAHWSGLKTLLSSILGIWRGAHLGGIRKVECDGVQGVVGPSGEELAQVGRDCGQDDSVGSQ